jgi:methylglutaconyl-CoA hydratase
MKNYKTIRVLISDGVAQVSLNRQAIHNAFNEEMIGELREAYTGLDTNSDVRVVVLQGEGKSFCAGADLNWMRDVAKYSYEENLKESENLSACFYAIYTCSKPTIAVVQGAAIGGANGLLAACDFVAAEEETVFSLSEVKIGIVPACISPYVVKRIGEYKARETMLTGMRFDGAKAKEMGLVNFSGTLDEVDNYIAEIIDAIQTSGPVAVSMCKRLLDNLTNKWSFEEARHKTAEMIAKLRQSEEGQEGMDAFLNKRKPNWVDEK